MTGILNSRWAALESSVCGFDWLTELSAPTPAQRPLAFVLDLSDSFPAPHHEIGQLRNLCRRLHRDTPIWIYRFSSAAPLDTGDIRLVHLLDGSLDLCQICTDRKLRDTAMGQGSFLRPPMQAIADRAATAGVSDLRTILVTDGELLDFGEVQIDPRIHARGLTNQLSAPKVRHWRRVLPRVPLCLLNDHLWDDWPNDTVNAAGGLVEICIVPSSAAEDVVICDLAARELRPFGNSGLRWNCATQPLLLAGVKHTETNCLIEYRFEGLDLAQSCQFGPHLAAIRDETMVAALDLLSRAGRRPTEFVIDISEGDPRFEALWSESDVAAEFVVRGQPWIDDQMVSLVFKNEFLRNAIVNNDNRWVCDGLLCLRLYDSQHKTGTRIVLVPLSKTHAPALIWSATQAPPGIDVQRSFGIVFDRMERRWSYFSGTTTIEIAPNSSAQLNAVDLTSSGQRWTAMFCGRL